MTVPKLGEDFAGQSDPGDLIAERDHLDLGIERLAVRGRRCRAL